MRSWNRSRVIGLRKFSIWTTDQKMLPPGLPEDGKSFFTNHLKSPALRFTNWDCSLNPSISFVVLRSQHSGHGVVCVTDGEQALGNVIQGFACRLEALGQRVEDF